VDDVTQTNSPRPVVVGLDGSHAALMAARFALDEARRRSAPLRVVTVVPWPHDGLTTLPPRPDLPALLRESGQSVAHAAVDASPEQSATPEHR
jgi:nucleotide-binding universal stress UspA family protein